MLAVVACARPPPCRYLSGSRSAGLTHRTKLLTTRLLRCSQARTHRCYAAASNGGFLADIFECNPLLRQQTSAIASAEFQESLVWAEVAATHLIGGGDIDNAPGTQRFKDTLRDVAISMSAAHGEKHIVFVRWRNNGVAPDGISKVTLYNVGFNLPELRDEFVRRAANAEKSSPGGFRIFSSAVAVSAAAVEKGFRFYVPIPSGWTDEELLHAMVMQGGLNPDHILSFGADVARGLNVTAPSGDLYFNFAPAGCITHGFAAGVPILQPPGRMFVVHPVSGIESHLTLRKAGACKHCWVPGRHIGDITCPLLGKCRVCLDAFEDMPGEGKRRACSQGHVFKEPVKRPVVPGAIPAEAPPSSPLAEMLRKRQEEGLFIAKEKRKRMDEPDDEPGLAPSEAVAQTPSNKASKTTGDSSPAKDSSAQNKAADQPSASEKAEGTPRTVTRRAHKGNK